jgi:N-acetylglucosamine-6-phosphate deacetylase
MTILKNLNIYLKDKMIENGYIIFDHKIIEIGEGDIEGGIDLKGKLLIPGFIDQHIHGIKGHDAMDANMDEFEQISKFLPYEGTTSFLATTMTDRKENIIQALERIRFYKENCNQSGAELLGVHLEGPFISPIYKGAQREDAIILPSIELFDELNQKSGYFIKQVTIAPEIPNALPLIKHLVKNNIVASIGHSNAKDVDVMEALSLGANAFSHGYNAMSRLHHRDLGVVGMMLLDDDSYAEVICDEIHASKLAVKLLYKNKTSNRLILVTDAMRAKLLGEGKYQLGGQDVYVNSDQARLVDGTLAGSVLRMIDGVKKMKAIANCSIFELIQMASYNPAKLHKIDDRKGSIEIGKDADLLVVDQDLNLYETYCRGIKQ